MMRRNRRLCRMRVWTGLVLSLWWALPLIPLPAAPPPVPPKLGPLLQQAQEQLRNQRPELAVETLQTYQGDDHALRHLLLGRAYREQTNWNSALTAYGRALELDATLDEARKALAHVHARLEQWAEAAAALGKFVNPWTSEADWVALYGQTALALEDHRLAQVLVEAGLVRFPDDLRFRQLDLAQLLKADDSPRAKAAILQLLKAEPGNARWWEQLAAVASQSAAKTEQSAALEAAVLADPDNLNRHRQFLSGLLIEGDWLTALEHGQQLLSGPLAGKTDRQPELLELLVRAADEGGQDALLARFLDLVPEPQRTKTMRLAEARSALRQGRSDKAREALDTLIAQGETDASVFLWAGTLAEAAGAMAEAETHYLQSAKGPGPTASLATLNLARLYHALDRRADAALLLRHHLEQHPEDAVARALLAAVSHKTLSP